MVIKAGSGHVAGPLDMADIFTALYFHILNQDSESFPKSETLLSVHLEKSLPGRLCGSYLVITGTRHVIFCCCIKFLKKCLVFEKIGDPIFENSRNFPYFRSRGSLGFLKI